MPTLPTPDRPCPANDEHDKYRRIDEEEISTYSEYRVVMAKVAVTSANSILLFLSTFMWV